MSTVQTKIMLVDDHAMLRHGMAMLINLEPDMEVFAEAGDGNEALVILKKNDPVDIVLAGWTVSSTYHNL